MRGSRTDASIESHPCLRGMVWSFLPQGWSLVHLEDVSDIISGIGFPVHLQGRTDEPIPFFKVGDVSEAWKRGNPVLRTANHHVSLEDVRRLRGQLLPKGTTVFAKIGAAIALNRRGLLATPSLVDNNVMGLAPGKVVDERFLFQFACVITLDAISQATTVPSVRKSDVAEIPFPLPPLPEQRRIVDEIDKQFTRLDAAVAGLRRIKANLKRYRASVLKAACEGRLVPTEAELARREGRSFESGEELLKRILKERRTSWEVDQLAKFKAAGKAPRDDSWKRRYAPPGEPEAEGLWKVPAGWAWATAGLVIWGIEAGASFRCDEVPPEAGQTGVVKVSAVTWGTYDERESKTCTNSARVDDRFLIRKGDFLFSRANTIDLVGACVITRRVESRVMLSDKILRFQLGGIPGEWLLLLLRSRWGRREIEALATGNQESMRNIGQERIRGIRIPIPPLAEQHRIVAEVERRLSVVDELEATVEKNLARCARLRQSILKMAFEGRLVPQDPNDEPASLLLERISRERDSAEVAGAPSRRRKAAKR